MKMILCTTEKDYIKMYTNGIKSCMQNQHRLTGDKPLPASRLFLRDIVFKMNKTWPSVFYHYFPNTQGVIFTEKGEIVARTLLLKTDKDKTFKTFGQVYGVNYTMTEKAEEMLEAAGYSDCEDTGMGFVTTKQKYEVPAVKSVMGNLCPIPFPDHIDNPNDLGTVRYSSRKETFIFNDKSPTAIGLTHDFYRAPNYLDVTLRPVRFTNPNNGVFYDF